MVTNFRRRVLVLSIVFFIVSQIQQVSTEVVETDRANTTTTSSPTRPNPNGNPASSPAEQDDSNDVADPPPYGSLTEERQQAQDEE